MAAKAIPLARTGALAPFVRFLDAIGAPTERLLEQSRLSPQALSSPKGLFALHQGLNFLDQSARSEGLPHFGLIVGQQTRIVELGELGPLLSSSTTLYAAIQVLVQAIPLFSSAERLSLFIQGNQAYFCHAFAFGGATGRHHGDLFTLMVMIDVIRSAAGPQWRPRAVWLPASERPHRVSYERLLETVVLFHADWWAIVFDRSLLAKPLCYFGNVDRGHEEPLQSLQALAPADDFSGSLRQVIASFLTQGNPHIGVVAEVAGLSVRTLQRRLREERCSFSQLVEDARLQAARRLMRETNVKLVDVALELGYSDAANFTRAFRRWTGLSPQAARRLDGLS